MSFVMGLGIFLAVISVLAVCTALKKVRHPFLRVLASAACGIAALGAVNLFAAYTEVSIAINYATAFVTVVLGAPGVISLLLLRLLLLF